MGYYKDQRILDYFGKRLKTYREAADLSQEQVHLSTGIGQSNIAKMELGKLNTSLSQLALLAELFGLEYHELLDNKASIPETEDLRKSVSKFLKKRGVDPATFLRKSITHLFETKLIQSKFLSTPRFSKEIAEYCVEKYNVEFTTSHISRAMESFARKGSIEILKTDKKSKFQYKKIE